MDLDDRRWGSLEGGYRIPYNAARPLKQLRDTNDARQTELILNEFWENLHHQGDVGLASYLAMPHIIDTLSQRRSFESKFISLIVCIENRRITDSNPQLTQEFDDYYFGALSRFEKYLLENLKQISDREALKNTLAFLATVNGQPGVGKVIEFLDDDEIDEFIEERI